MTSISKTVLALLLLAGGFIAAKTFGPPDLAERLVDSWRPESSSGYGELQPAPFDRHRADFLPPLEMSNPPAGFQTAHAEPAPPAAPPSGWGAPPEQVGGWAARAPDPALTPSSFEEEMAPLRPLNAPVQAAPATAWQTPVASPEPSRSPAPPEPPALNPPAGWSDGWGEPSRAAAPAAQPPADWPPAVTAPVREVSQSTAAQPTMLGPPPADDWETPASSPLATDWQTEPAAALAPLTPPSPWAEEGGQSKSHIVADGDSLPRLAERYLGDASRSSEIYELNRQQLTHPELLPLGLELKLPR
ncbi:hypothetical protein KOR34_34700 [Posidoniimonas corsicana]|uniref:LysM domain-containing protein n=1 Tax=Posidoniimonas corsicana TaxID=1938618 RepID=A0A5C5V753_9BACT|nr:hypothetical protein [Posidoniimonas corsicana]TWT33637.1 hypothetical protein KOR34_34700 [Posidoniimonas corsicana]